MLEVTNSPAFVIDEKCLNRDVTYVRAIIDRSGSKLLYSPKACALSTVLSQISPHVHGFACSSINELRLADQAVPGERSRHLVTPLVTPHMLATLDGALDYLTLNSLSQWQRLRTHIPAGIRVGLRVNPQMSFIHDPRYDPCRPNSKLGVPIDTLNDAYAADPRILDGLSGLHFHSNCDDGDLAHLLATARRVNDGLPEILARVEWINMGGGYLFDRTSDFGAFESAVALFRDGYGLDVFIEPGAALVRRAGTIVATVHDIIDGDDTQIAVLDTTVNHMPEVFEYQFEPDVLGHSDGGQHVYTLVGCSCLAGDVFGQYAFDSPLALGSQLTFLNMGAYTMAKAHRFNGIPLPAIYARRPDGTLECLGEDTFENFSRYLKVNNHEVV